MFDRLLEFKTRFSYFPFKSDSGELILKTSEANID